MNLIAPPAHSTRESSRERRNPTTTYVLAFLAAIAGKASKAIDARTGEPDPHLVYLNEVLLVGGGVPIHAGGELIGAIGVAGSPGSVHDEECADAGIAAIAASLG